MFEGLLDMEKILAGTKVNEAKAPAGKIDPVIKPGELAALQAKAATTPMDFFRDLEWAYTNLGNSAPVNPPSGSALHLLNYGTSARTEFMKLISSYMMKKEKQKEAEDARRDDRRTQMKFIKSLQDEMQGVSSDMLKDVEDEELVSMCKERGITLES